MKKAFRKMFGFDESFLVIALIAVIVVLSILSPYFFTSKNIINVLRQCSITLIAGVGMTILMLVGEIDLSIGSLAAFVSVIVSKTLNATTSIAAAIIVGIMVGVAFGLLNALIVNKFNINSLIVTLGMMSILRGTSLIITDAIAIQNNISEFTTIGTGYVGPIPIPVIIAAVVFVVGFILLKYTTFGRYVYASGGNSKAAVISGINVKMIKTVCFVLCSALAAVTAIILTSRINSGQPNLAIGFEMTVIAATILGGTSLAGGQGSLLGTLLGILILGMLENGLVLLDVSSFYQEVVRGTVIILAVILDQTRAKRKESVETAKNLQQNAAAKV